ncbi:MAG: ankyrin repeat domain-containing protein [Bryobacterales bacterium]|nr:ankyrin repeat domain-containing protein [Bryobacterales bacterium]
MNERILERAIKELSRKSLKHVNKRCFGFVVDSQTQGWTPLLIAALKLSDRHLPVFRHLLENKAAVGLRVLAREEGERLAGAALTGREIDKAFNETEKAAIVGLLTALGAKPDPRYEGATALHIAVDKPGTVSVAALLIENGAEISGTTIAGATALHFASARGDIATLELLLEHEADVEERDDRGYTALHYAAAEGSNARAVMMLIDLAGADTMAVTDAGETAYDLIMQNPKLKGSEAVAALKPS